MLQYSALVLAGLQLVIPRVLRRHVCQHVINENYSLPRDDLSSPSTKAFALFLFFPELFYI
jgi:hypothetical protein